MIRRLLATVALSASALGTAQAVTVTSIAGTGTFFNSPSALLTDGDFGLGFGWSDAPTVYWAGQTGAAGVAFTLTLDTLYTLQDVRIGVDSNDFYAVQTSTNGTTWNTLFTSLSAGIDPGFEWGGSGSLIKKSSVLGEAGYSSLIDFPASPARYVRIFAAGGDDFYALSEVQLVGTAVPVPEPMTAAMLLSGLSALGFLARRRLPR
jgi:hypothetical protein